jgi:hypothetical protein
MYHLTDCLFSSSRSLRSELENGRLAMIAFLGQVGSELVTGKTVDEQIEYLQHWILSD